MKTQRLKRENKQGRKGSMDDWGRGKDGRVSSTPETSMLPVMGMDLMCKADVASWDVPLRKQMHWVWRLTAGVLLSK